MDTTQLVRQASPIGYPSASRGYINSTPMSPSDPVDVILPGGSTERHYGPCLWPSIHGATLPAAGDVCVVVFDEQNHPTVVWWEGKTVLQVAERGRTELTSGEQWVTAPSIASKNTVLLTLEKVSGNPTAVIRNRGRFRNFSVLEAFTKSQAEFEAAVTLMPEATKKGKGTGSVWTPEDSYPTIDGFLLTGAEYTNPVVQIGVKALSSAGRNLRLLANHKNTAKRNGYEAQVEVTNPSTHECTLRLIKYIEGVLSEIASPVTKSVIPLGSWLYFATFLNGTAVELGLYAEEGGPALIEGIDPSGPYSKGYIGLAGAGTGTAEATNLSKGETMGTVGFNVGATETPCFADWAVLA